MDPDDQQLTDDHHGSKEEKLAGGNGHGAKAAETNETPPQNLRICDFCGKSFTSGKALGGHRRSHFQVLKAQCRLKKEMICAATTDNMNDSTAEKKHTCCLCSKDFPSMKSLFGHMRSHPGRVWKGILPPPASSSLAPPQTEGKSCSSSSTSSGHGECNQDIDGDGYMMMNPDTTSNISAAEPVDLLKDLSEGMRWKVTAKRGRRSVGVVAAAKCLLHLSRGKYLPSQINNHFRKTESGKISEFSLIKRRGIDHRSSDNDDNKNKVKKIKLICRRVGSEKLRDKTTDSSLHNMDNPQEDDDNLDYNQHRLKKESKNRGVEEGAKSKEIPVMKSSTQLDGVSEFSKKMKKNKMKMHSYKCGRCSKTFSTFQALGGHRSSHHKDNCIPSTDDETTIDASIVLKVKINEANEIESMEISNTTTEEAYQNCNQTLKGSFDHASLSEASKSREAHDSSGKLLGLDLNLPYAIEDECGN